MHATLDVFTAAQALAGHAAARHAVIAGNIAHADTPGFRARDLAPFTPPPPAGGGAETAGLPRHLAALAADRAAAVAERAARLGADPAGPPAPWRPPAPRLVEVPGAPAPNGNTVALEAEMTRAAEARGRHDLALTVYRSAAGLLRATLAR